ncbi:MAG: type I glyceraldehyde-3-phosphate dehydrogenase [Candidatus Marinimicrobia bacterium]|nr:type I glyceraldehyde-3-phosphate dehydrogenase [Candidatus Neomarinimicrobiota bacterium]|tara:strand:- start:549 stop:1544 length:996 start_codon:yes stop_codon:yes gene_type:complete
MRVAINGFGRIGRSVFRILDQIENIKVVAINDLSQQESLAYLLKYDTVMGKFNGNIRIENNTMITDNDTVQMLSERDPSNLPWKEYDVDVVIESTGVFTKKKLLENHLNSGAKKVLLTVPAKDEIDNTIVLGVNDDSLTSDHRIVSNASCTTNCLAPMAKILDNEFGIKQGVMNTIHAYTNDQRLADVPHSDFRRSRAAAENIIPTSTGAARAVGKVLPQMQGKLDGIASRVPVPDGSVVDLFVELEKKVTVAEVNKAILDASKSSQMKNVLYYSENPIVSSDIIGNPFSSIYDSRCTKVVSGRYLRTLNWYDNEWGYSNRVVDLIQLMCN